MKFILLLNDNNHQNLFASELCKKYGADLVAVVMSTKVLPGKEVSFFRSSLRYFRTAGVYLFLFRTLEMIVFKLKRILGYLHLRHKGFDIYCFCKDRGIPLIPCSDINDPAFVERLRIFEPDVAFSRINQIMRSNVIAVPRLGMVNTHLSLLPKFKGIDAVFWGMLLDDPNFGITFHFVSEKIDAGDVIEQFPVYFTSGSLHDREKCLNNLAATRVVEIYERFKNGQVHSSPMGAAGASYYSFATKMAYRKFRKKGHKLISSDDFFSLVCGTKP